MAQTSSEPSPQTQLQSIVAAAKSGKPASVYLLVGESADTRAAANALIDALVPAASRSFNLETYDGRATGLSVVLDSLRTRGFFPGTKVVWLRESPVLLSGEKRGDVAKAMLTAWVDGREQDAMEKLLSLVALAGWDQQQLEAIRWTATTKTRVREVFGDDVDSEDLAAIDKIHSAALSRELKVAAHQDESTALLEFLEAGMPPQCVLVLSAGEIDGRKRLVKRIKELGAAIDFKVVRERSGALSREAVEELVAQVARQFGKQLAAPARELILRRAGNDAQMLLRELEKLCLFSGEAATVGESDVRLSFRDMAESWIFDFTAAFCSRSAAKTLPLLRGLFEQGEPPLRLLAMVARELRLLLAARECLEGSLRGRWRANVAYNDFQSRVLPEIDADTQATFGKSHPFVLYRRFQDASQVPAPDLRTALIRLSELDLRLKSAPGDPKIQVEAFVLDWCRRPQARAA